MLEAATVRWLPGADGFDAGRLLNTLLYYDQVNLILDARSFPSVVKAIGIKNLTTLVQHPRVVTEITAEQALIRAHVRNGVCTYRPLYMKYRGTKGGKTRSTEAVLLNMVREGDQGVRLAQIDRLLSGAKKTSYLSLIGEEAKNHQILKSLIGDADMVKQVLQGEVERGAISIIKPVEQWRIDVLDLGEEVALAGNIGIEVLSHTPFDEDIDIWGGVLMAVQDYAVDAILSQSRATDMIGREDVRDFSSRPIQRSVERMSARNIQAFEEAVFDHAGALGNSFNEGKIGFDEALRLIDRADKFRGWLKGLPPSVDILSEFHSEVARETNLEKLPGSTLRFTLFTGGGVAVDAVAGSGGIGTAAGVALSAFDTFVVTNLLRGWRPNVFVEDTKKALSRAERRG